MEPEPSESLAALFPAGVVVFTLDDEGPPPDLLPEDAAAVARAVPKRRAEFARGRACARAALAALGLPVRVVPVGPDRAPVWPAGAIGSITHCQGLVAAAVGRPNALRGLGLDAEPHEPIDPDLTRRIATPEELAAAAGPGAPPDEVLSRLVFSAKEVVHKCIHPIAGVTLDFLDVEVAFDHGASQFSVAPRGDRARALPELAAIDGRYRIDAHHIVTAGVIGAGR